MDINAPLTIEERSLMKEVPGRWDAIPESAPPRFARRMIEIRAALDAGREVPEPSAEYRASMSFADRLFQIPTVRSRTVTPPAVRLNVPRGMCLEELRDRRDETETLALRIRLRQQGERLAAEKRDIVKAMAAREKQAAENRAVERELFPWMVHD
jgi:hypothetical protein